MTAANFDKSLKFVLDQEGGNDDDPDDPGGRTSRGITQREYTSWLRGHGRVNGDVWSATDADVREIYHTQYWLPWCDQLPTGVDYLAFDMFVNTGMAQGTKMIQRGVKVDADGHMGLCTLDAVNSTTDKVGLIKNISEQRRDYYRKLKTFWKYGKGWLRRVDFTENNAIIMAGSDVETATQPTTATSRPDSGRKALPTDIDDKTPLVRISPEASGGVTTGLGGASATLDQIQQQLAPYSDTLRYIKYALLLLTLIGIGITVWGFVKRNNAQAVM